MKYIHNEIECYIDYKPYNLTADIWFFFHNINGTINFINFSNMEYVTLNPGDKPEEKNVTPLKLPYNMIKALIKEGSNILPPDKVMENHLKDTITVRDRLLSLIERNYPYSTPYTK